MNERDEKTGRFKKGKSGNPATQFSGGRAEEMQLRSAEARKRNRTLAETLRAELDRKASSGSALTKMEYLVQKALSNHAQGTLTLKDLTYMQKILGEETLNVNHHGLALNITVGSQQTADELNAILATGAQPADPDENDADL